MHTIRAAGLAVLLVGAAAALAADTELKVGDPAPAFEAMDDQGKEWKSADVVGKKIVVVYFYPADCTGTCTKQAKGYRDNLEKLAEKGATVVGVSGDTVDNHKVFKQKEKLNFTLLADPEGKVAKAFGVPYTAGKKSFKTMVEDKEIELTREGTAQRWTFVIGKDGKILHKDTKAPGGDDAKTVLEVIEKAGQ